MRLESRRLSPYLFTCDVTHSLSVKSHLQAFVLHFILSIKFAEKKKRNKNRKNVICHRDLADAGPGVPGRVNLGSDTWFSSVVIPGAQVVFAAIRPNIYLCFVVYEPKHGDPTVNRDY